MTVSWQGCHPPEVLAGSSQSTTSLPAASLPQGAGSCASSLGCFILLWFGNYGRGEPHPAVPPGDLCTGGSSASPSHQLRVASFSFLSFSCLRGWGGGDRQGSAGKPVSHACGRGPGPVPHPSRGRGATGMGSGVAGQDGMAGVCCGSRLRWIRCKEEKAHTDLTGAPSPHPNKCQSRHQQPPVLGALPGASLLCASRAGGGLARHQSCLGGWAR